MKRFTVCICLLVMVSTGYASHTLGPLHTQGELALMRQRVGLESGGSAVCPDGGSTCYVNDGDVQTGSPGDWARIVTNKNSFMNSPSADRYLGHGSCPASQNEGPFGGGNWPRGVKIRDAAVYAAVAQDATVRNAVITEMLVHANAANLAWQNDTLFGCVTFQGAVALPWNSLFIKMLIGYTFIRPDISAGNRSTMDTWFLRFAQRQEEQGHTIVVKRFPNRKSGSYSNPAFTNGCPGTQRIYLSSPQDNFNQCNFMSAWTNTIMFHYVSVAIVGVMLDNTALKAEATRYFQEVIKYGVFPNGTHHETYRGMTQNVLHGMVYSGVDVLFMAIMAEVFARDGDPSLYNYSTSIGLFGTEGGPKTLRTMIDHYTGRTSGAVNIYAQSITTNNKLDSNIQADNWQTVDDVVIAATVQNWYGDGAIEGAVFATNGRPAYETAMGHACGVENSWQGGFCLLPTPMLQYAGTEGLVDPHTGAPGGAEPMANRCFVQHSEPDIAVIITSAPNGALTGTTGFTLAESAISGVACGTVFGGSPGCRLTMATPIATEADTRTLSYSQATGNVSDGAELAAFSGLACTNYWARPFNIENVISFTTPAAGRPFSALFDGDHLSEASSWVVGGVPPVIIQAVWDLSIPLALTSATYGPDNAGNIQCETIQLESSVNGTSWSNVVGPVSCNFPREGGLRTEVFGSTSARYWRVTITDDRNGASTGVQLMELQASTGSPPPPPQVGSANNLAILGVSIFGLRFP